VASRSIEVSICSALTQREVTLFGLSSSVTLTVRPKDIAAFVTRSVVRSVEPIANHRLPHAPRDRKEGRTTERQ
jgi:hypothetical protein